jgi:cell division protein FtsB
MAARAHPQRYRARPAPRSGPSRGSRINWERLGRRVLVLVLFAVLASYLNPVVNLVDDWRDSQAEKERFAELLQENERLTKRAEAIRNPAAAEQQARRQGMVGPGERAYVIRGLPD